MTPRKHPFTHEEFFAIYSRVPRSTVEIVIPTSHGIVLVERQEKSWQGLWHIPGGTILYNESVTDTISRIAMEELGIEVSMGALIGYIEYPSEEKERGFGWSVGMAFLCTPIGELPLERWEAQGIRCFPVLPEKMIEEQRPIAQLALDHYRQ